MEPVQNAPNNTVLRWWVTRHRMLKWPYLTPVQNAPDNTDFCWWATRHWLIVQELCESRWPSWAVSPNEPSGFHGRKELLNHASALVTTCPIYVNWHLSTLSINSSSGTDWSSDHIWHLFRMLLKILSFAGKSCSTHWSVFISSWALSSFGAYSTRAPSSSGSCNGCLVPCLRTPSARPSRPLPVSHQTTSCC